MNLLLEDGGLSPLTSRTTFPPPTKSPKYRRLLRPLSREGSLPVVEEDINYHCPMKAEVECDEIPPDWLIRTSKPTSLEIRWKISLHPSTPDPGHPMSARRSPTFLFSNQLWQLLCFPNGPSGNSKYISLYLSAVGPSADSPFTQWRQPLEFTFTALHPSGHPALSKTRKERHTFTPVDSEYGFTSFLKHCDVFLRDGNINDLSLSSSMSSSLSSSSTTTVSLSSSSFSSSSSSSTSTSTSSSVQGLMADDGSLVVSVFLFSDRSR